MNCTKYVHTLTSLSYLFFIQSLGSHLSHVNETFCYQLLGRAVGKFTLSSFAFMFLCITQRIYGNTSEYSRLLAGRGDPRL